MMTLKMAALALLAVVNLVSFVLMGVDKRRARRGKWRIPERTLFLAAACFGALGGTLGMFYFHHKTKHWYFRIGFPALLMAQVVLILWGLSRAA
ncbi:MAG: DUF1294 domain-containing protein [Christensenellaceae bacterium]|nr:DUF1294 domain-containing protein [Christensenellaceae bacterium]